MKKHWWLGKKHTKESKKKMSIAQKKRWERIKANPEKFEQVRRNIGRASKGRIKGMEKHPAWKGGRYIDRAGYVLVRKKDALSRRSDGYTLEHRYVMEKFLGRPLSSNEEVHHKNGIKTDNRLENLELVVKKLHFGEVRCPFCLKSFKIK